MSGLWQYAGFGVADLVVVVIMVDLGAERNAQSHINTPRPSAP